MTLYFLWKEEHLLYGVETTQNITVSQFNLLDDLEDDIISHKMPNIRRDANDLDDEKS